MRGMCHPGSCVQEAANLSSVALATDIAALFVQPVWGERTLVDVDSINYGLLEGSRVLLGRRFAAAMDAPDLPACIMTRAAADASAVAPVGTPAGVTDCSGHLNSKMLRRVSSSPLL